MKLKYKYANEADIPAEHKAMYKKADDGSWVLDVEGAASADALAELRNKVNEFRDNNTELQKKIKELDGKVHLTKEEHEELKKLKEQADKNKDQKLIEEGKIEELFAQRTQRMREDYEAKITALQNQNKELETKFSNSHGRLSSLLVESEVNTALSEVAIPRKGALADIASRAGRTWKVNDKGQVVAMNDDGSAVYGPKGEPLTMKEWAADLVKTAPFLFEEGAGGGNRGGSGRQPDNKNAARILRNDERAKSANIEAIAKGNAVLVEG